MTITALLASVVNWLRIGYPEGVPASDRIPLLEPLRATPLTEDQIRDVVRNLTADHSTALAAVRPDRRNGPGPRETPE